MKVFAACTALLTVLTFSAFGPAPALAQTGGPRFGLGFNVLGSTADGVGLGLRGRASAPVNRDLSIGIDLGAAGFVLEGRRGATWVFDPQISAIITVPTRRSRAMYYLAGVGAYVPISNDDPDEFGETDEPESGPTVHGGVGWIQRLTDTTIFYEIDPALVIAEESLHLAFPFRFGIIF